jgi:hypothetical protein
MAQDLSTRAAEIILMSTRCHLRLGSWDPESSGRWGA